MENEEEQRRRAARQSRPVSFPPGFLSKQELDAVFEEEGEGDDETIDLEKIPLETPRRTFSGWQRYNDDLATARSKMYNIPSFSARERGFVRPEPSKPPSTILDAFQDPKWVSSFFAYLDDEGRLHHDREDALLCHLLMRDKEPSADLIHDYWNDESPLRITWPERINEKVRKNSSGELDLPFAEMQLYAFQALTERYENFKALLRHDQDVVSVPNEDEVIDLSAEDALSINDDSEKATDDTP